MGGFSMHFMIIQSFQQMTHTCRKKGAGKGMISLFLHVVCTEKKREILESDLVFLLLQGHELFLYFLIVSFRAVHYPVQNTLKRISFK